jgi:hypothetical protein
MWQKPNMANSSTHRQKRGKNLTLLVVLIAIVAGLFYLTIVKMQGA